jgi:hypothetical protein
VDWDNDGDKDLIVGENNGNVRYYQNIGTPSVPNLHYVGLMQAGGVTIDVGDYSTPCVTDWNGDGLLDLLVGESDGVINLYLNQGTATNPVLRDMGLLNAGGATLDVGYRSAPAVADFNGDGVKDLISGEMNGKVYYYHNSGTNANPVLDAGVYLQNGALQVSTISTSRPALIDWNNDGHMDFVLGSYDARLKRFNWAATTLPAPSCDVNLTSSYMVPAAGGRINYTMTANNGSSSTVNFDIWSQIQQPNYTWMEVLLRTGNSLAPGASLSRSLTMQVPSTWASGIYYYYGYVGNHANLQVYSSDYFYFYKNTTGDGPTVDEFSFTPWEDEIPAVNVQVPQRPEIAAYPNPFNPTTTINFDLIEEGAVKISVYNISGQQVAELVNTSYPAGSHQITWDASYLPAGVYLMALDAGHYHTAQKVTLLK